MSRLPSEPRTDSAVLHRRPPVSLRFVLLLRATDLDNEVATRGRVDSPRLRERSRFSKISDKKRPGAPPPDNRSIHQTHDVVRDSRILLPVASVRVRLR